MKPVFITGIGTGVGKTVWSAIVTEALGADYWKPVQAGFEEGTDSLFVLSMISNKRSKIHPELYKLTLPASPHIAAREEKRTIDLDLISEQFGSLESDNEFCVVEGAGGLMVPLNESEFVGDLISKLGASVLLVSRNYLGSINHSMLTVMAARNLGLDIRGWLFNDRYMDYENELENWSGIAKLGSIPFTEKVTPEFIREQALKVEPILKKIL